MKKTITTLIALLVTIGINAQTLEWAKSFGGANEDYGYSITVDALGNVYTTGHFQDTVDFDPGAGTTNLSSNGFNDVFVQKMDPQGNLLWAKSFGGTSNEYCNSITVDASGNIYTTGHFEGTVDFDPGAGTTNLSSNGNNDVFVQKMNSSGNLLWAKSFGGTNVDRGYAITVDASGNIYTTGHFQDTVDFDPGAGTTNLSSNGFADVFVQKMDLSGNFLWAKSFGGTSNEYCNSITVDASGNVYTTGRFRVTVDFDPGAGTTNLSSNGSDDVFVQKMDQQGNLLWAKSFGGSSVEIGRSITVDASGNVYTTGHFQDTVDFDPGAGTTNLSSNGGADFFVQKMSQLNTGVIENNFEHKLTVYPNPTSGNFSIDLGAVYEASIVSITDISGKLIESKTITQSQVLNLSIKEPAGIYIVSIQTGNKKATIGLVKE
ncbi:MAG: hypothetical protein COB15_10840 [Flavobacteriales bacterium]|nr:MAG: hypothetical protein COB15_10840 [Flavobacteriales bacterium]